MFTAIAKFLREGSANVDPNAFAEYKAAVGAGAVAGTGNTVVEAMAPLNKTVITLASTLTTTDNVGAAATASQKIYDFPEGDILVVGAVIDATLTRGGTNIAATFNGDIGLGTAAVATNGTALTTTTSNILPSTSTVAAVAGVGRAQGESFSTVGALTDSSGGTSSATIAALTGTNTSALSAELTNIHASLTAKINALAANAGGVRLLGGAGFTTAKDCYLNILIDDGDSAGNSTLAVAGTVTLIWTNLGDYTAA